MHQYAAIEETVYLWFAANNTAGSGNDGATPVYDVRLAGAAADAAPVLSGNATLLSHANYPAGAHEIAIPATAVNGFAADAVYAVFCTLLVDSRNPTGFVGSFKLTSIQAAAAAAVAAAGLATLAKQGEILTAIGEIDGGGGVAGAGADNVTIVIAVGGVAVADADVWISSDAPGSSVVAGTLQTNSNGRVTFKLDEGATYYLWMQKDGVNSIMGERFVAVGD